ncbi:S46 family peptidase [uncultured Sunxiuqinia sp.]|uniref:S46 family peptidase n=1 Tax=uncultured Sunxiuqinia sp. TaxID=1573825 RepID=UPI002AA65E27|nr:S46 family peptidase [uncultured Sunxiuqinia sp.]
MKNFLFALLIFRYSLSVYGKEGIWVPTLLDKYTIDEMQEMGFKLTAEDIYSINQNSLKDAVVIFGKGCTGAMISDQGLLLTNHHCGFSSIQSHSSVEQDYLSDGFWAMSKEEELSNPGLTARFLERMVDVTDSVYLDCDSLQAENLQLKLNENIKRLQKNASEDGKCEAVIKPLFFGNQYFLYIYKVFPDVRLVGAPPESIGKFGGDTDNWMWPRHNADFAIFRVYADENNEPAAYSESNVPYQPRKWLPISLDGVKPNDFMMLMGYPGTTQEYLPSQAVEMLIHQSNPDRITIRTARLNIFSKHMRADPETRIQYASKFAKSSNSWKRWEGEIRGLNRLSAVEKKREFEAEFEAWYQQDDRLEEQYRSVLPQFDKLYVDLLPFDRAYNYYQEVVFKGIDIFDLPSYFPKNDRGWKRMSESKRDLYRKAVATKVDEFYRNYNKETDQEVFLKLLRMLRQDLEPSFLPADFKKMFDRYDDEKIIRKIYDKSVLADPQKMKEISLNFNEKWIAKLQKDPLVELYHSLRFHYVRNVELVYRAVNEKIETVQKTYMQGILAMQKDERLYPDANFTMRIAYGKVQGYEPHDGVEYDYYTTLTGIMEKVATGNPDYQIPEKLKSIYRSKDFDGFSENGEMPVAYIASIHSTGGNSGSPAINANGELVGLNFDRCWEGTMSDIMFDPDQCRNIMLDVRYMLLIIDKYAGAGYLLDEMEIIDNTD